MKDEIRELKDNMSDDKFNFEEIEDETTVTAKPMPLIFNTQGQRYITTKRSN